MVRSFFFNVSNIICKIQHNITHGNVLVEPTHPGILARIYKTTCIGINSLIFSGVSWFIYTCQGSKLDSPLVSRTSKKCNFLWKHVLYMYVCLCRPSYYRLACNSCFAEIKFVTLKSALLWFLLLGIIFLSGRNSI